MKTFQLSRDGKVFGPMTQEEIQEGLCEGTVLRTDYVWQEGMEKWEPIESVFYVEVIEEEIVPEATAPATEVTDAFS